MTRSGGYGRSFGARKGIEAAQERYEGWWLNKRCRQAGSQRKFKKVVKVEAIGNPSFVYGIVELTFDDGSKDFVRSVDGKDVFRPRKKDIEVEPS